MMRVPSDGFDWHGDDQSQFHEASHGQDEVGDRTTTSCIGVLVIGSKLLIDLVTSRLRSVPRRSQAP